MIARCFPARGRRMACAPLLTWLVLGLLVPAMAQESGPTSRPTSQPTSRPSGPVEVMLDVQLLNISDALQSGHGGGIDSQPMADVDVHVLVLDEGAQQSYVMRSDADGRIQKSIGTHPPDSQVTVIAQPEKGKRYVAHPFPAWRVPPESVRLFEISGDRSKLVQRIQRIVTPYREPRPDSDPDDVPLIHVRQIATVYNPSFFVFLGDDEAGGYVLPVPEGANVLELRVDGRDRLDRDFSQTKEWGHGIVIRTTIYPLYLRDARTDVNMMVTYTLPAERGAVLDMGFHTGIITDSFILALEEPHFSAVTDGAQPFALRDIGFETIASAMSGSVSMHKYELARIRDGVHVPAPVRYGLPPVHPKTKAITVAIVLGFALSIGLGLLVAHSRRGLRLQEDALRGEAS